MFLSLLLAKSADLRILFVSPRQEVQVFGCYQILIHPSDLRNRVQSKSLITYSKVYLRSLAMAPRATNSCNKQAR